MTYHDEKPAWYRLQMCVSEPDAQGRCYSYGLNETADAERLEREGYLRMDPLATSTYVRYWTITDMGRAALVRD